MTVRPPVSGSGWVGVTGGVLVGALGLLVMVGWMVGSELLVRLDSGFIAMRFNTGLCFLAGGLGLVAVVRGWRRVGLAAAAVLVGVGGVVGLEFLTGSDWGSDVWLRSDMLGGVWAPGRMHETTAAGFVMLGVALGLVGWPGRVLWRVSSAMVLAVSAGGLGLVGLFGYVANLSTVSRTAELVGFGMALHTAAGLVVLGLGAVGAGISGRRSGEVEAAGAWRAPLAGLAVLAVGLVLWQALVADERDRIREANVEMADRLAVEAGFRTELMLVAVEALAHTVATGGGEGFGEEARFWLSKTPGLVAVGRLDSGGELVEVAVVAGRPEAEYSQLVEGYLGVGAGRSVVAVPLPNGTRGLVVYRPLAGPGGGWVAAVVGSRSLLSAVFDGLGSGYSAMVVEAGEVVFAFGPENAPGEGDVPAGRPLGVLGIDWTLQVWPGPEQLAALGSPLPELALAGAVTVSLLFAAAVHFATSAQVRRRDAETAGTALAEEVAVRRRAQADLETLAERLGRSNRELQDFAFVASHDLQEPLRKIQAFGDRLTSRLGDTLDEKSADYLTRMVDASRRMQILINDLLAFSRLTSRARPFQRVDLNQVVGEVVGDLDLALAESGGRVVVGDLPSIDAEPTQMRQLFQNLIGNAVKYRHPQRAPTIRISTDPSRFNGSVRISVEDNGIGFEPGQTERIFQLFQRLHGRGEYEGSGMGLAISRRIVERHGGTVVAWGDPGKGSTFTVTLPIEQRTEEDAT